LVDRIGGLGNISAKLFCKRSRVAFMPCGVVLKDERRTSNEKTNTQYQTFNSYFCFFSAVLILVTKILINSSVFCKISSNSSGFLNSVSSSFPIQRSMLDVRCSFFTVSPGQKQLSAYGDWGSSQQLDLFPTRLLDQFPTRLLDQLLTIVNFLTFLYLEKPLS
jgi:hypothetical protein